MIDSLQKSMFFIHNHENHFPIQKSSSFYDYFIPVIHSFFSLQIHK